MGGTGVVEFVHDSTDLLRALNAARKGHFKVRIPAKNGALPPEVAVGLNELFAANQRMARELEELRRERKDLLRALRAFEEGDFSARASGYCSFPHGRGGRRSCGWRANWRGLAERWEKKAGFLSELR